MQRFTGHSLLAVGILHTLGGLLAFITSLGAIARDGFVNAVDPHPDRQAAFWVLLSGVLLMTLGHGTRWAQQRTGTLPPALGWALLAVAAAGAILMPFSGFWLLFPPALLVLAAARQSRAKREEDFAVERRPVATGSTPARQ